MNDGRTTGKIPPIFDEMKGFAGDLRQPYEPVARWLAGMPPEQLPKLQQQADLLFERMGITFGAYGAAGGHERSIPFDLIPRVIGQSEWTRLEKGLKQRVRALNAFLHDAYHTREICKAGLMPEEQIVKNGQFLPVMQDFDLPRGIYAHICGVDLVRVSENQFYVLEDNCRVPSGVSYMLENREVMMRLLPNLFTGRRVKPVAQYAEELLKTLKASAFKSGHEPKVVLLTPGQYNSAYFEHAFLADEMGVELVKGHDLFVEDRKVYMRTPQGPQQVDVIYRRIDDIFLDPNAFRPDSLLGIPGLISAYRAGNVNLANACGTGIADDKATYVYVPEMIRFYLGEEPLLENVPTYRCALPDDLKYVLEHLDELVVKEVHGSGGAGMLVGPTASKAEIEAFRTRVIASPAGYIAQPTLALSTCPTFVEEGVAPRHVDLRPFVLSGEDVVIMPGGLTRVALKRGSLVVNSSQGGGTKDTWVLADER
jgi:uncharacterized circularly permuted ATP-grasp superfamily protein